MKYIWRDRAGAPANERISLNAHMNYGGSVYVGIGNVNSHEVSAGVRLSCLKTYRGSRCQFHCYLTAISSSVRTPTESNEVEFTPITSGNDTMDGAFEIFFKREKTHNGLLITTSVVQRGSVLAKFQQQASGNPMDSSYRLWLGINALRFRNHPNPILLPTGYEDYPVTSRSVLVDYFGTDVLEPADPKVPFYRSHNPFSGAHFFTSSFVEHLVAANNGHRSEGVGFNGLRIKEAGSTELYRLFNLQKGYHYYTTNAAERDYLVSLTPKDNPSMGWRYEGVVGFIFPALSGRGNTIYRLYNRDSGAHLFTTSLSTVQDIVRRFPNSWRQESDLGEAPR